MASEDFDPAEIDRLVEGLAKRHVATSPAPPVVPPDDPSRVTLPESDCAILTPGKRWTTARLLMPAARTEPNRALTFLRSLSLPALPTLPALPRIPTLPKIPYAALAETLSGPLWARLFVGLGVLLSAALPHWPYAHAWSWGLILYLSAVALLLVTGVWGAKLTWDERLPAAHTVAVGIVLWSFGLLAAEAVPRIAYV